MCIAQGACTYSKNPNQFMLPKNISHADFWYSGVLHIDKHKVADFSGGLGANFLNANSGVGSLPFKEEVILAEMIKDRFPCIEKLKFLKTGSDACSAAVRIARAFTSKKWIIGSGYHGWHDWAISNENPGAGTLKHFQHYGKRSGLAEVVAHVTQTADTDIAAVIVEPVQLDIDVKSLLIQLRHICTEKEIILIFDETITGLRFPKYCVANHFNIQPDLIILGKALGGGHPLAVVGGRADLMDNPNYFVSSTFAGDQYALKSAIENLGAATEENIKVLWDRGLRFLSRFNALSNKVFIKGYPTRGELQGDDKSKALFMQEMWERGYLFGRAFFLSFYHTEAILEKTLKDAKEVFAKIKAGKVRLKGKMPKILFKRN